MMEGLGLVIFLQNGYDPFPDANSICVQALVNELSFQKKDVKVVCAGFKGYEDKFSKDERIIHVPTSKPVLFYMENFWGKLKTIVCRFAVIPLWPIRFPSKVKNFYKTVCRIIDNNDSRNITVISVYKPAEMLEVGYRLKKKYPQIRFIIYNLDGINPDILLFKSQLIQRKEIKWQLNRCRKADLIVQMEPHKNHFLHSDFSKYCNKTVFLDYPLIVDQKDNINTNTRNSDFPIQLLYAGSFYKGLREPNYLLMWIKKLSLKKSVHLDLYTMNDFIDYLEKESREINSSISRYDYIPPYEMNIKINQADYLVSVGNAKSDMVPSKIFTYMSACKPIIHFVSDDQDSCLYYLNRYPLCLILDERDSVEQNVEKTLRFFDALKNNKALRFSDVEQLFHENTPIHTIQAII